MGCSRLIWGFPCSGGEAAPSIFVLRNNDIGDLLCITPLFEALKRLYPDGKVLVGIGDWNRDVLENNPFVDKVIAINAPWHNKTTCRYPQNSWRGRAAALLYLVFSSEVRQLCWEDADIGIDVLGSPHGALLFLRSGIRLRIGTCGYHSNGVGFQEHLNFDKTCYVGTAALKFAVSLGLPEQFLPAAKPQIYLSALERDKADVTWEKLATQSARKKRLVVGFSGGYKAKCWPIENFRRLLELLSEQRVFTTVLVGGPHDAEAGLLLARGLEGVFSMAGEVSLRDTFALTASGDAVVTNPSMLMHVAAAFEKPAAIVLGEEFQSAYEHSQLWSCNPFASNMGKEDNNPSLATPDEVYNFLLKCQ